MATIDTQDQFAGGGPRNSASTSAVAQTLHVNRCSANNSLAPLPAIVLIHGWGCGSDTWRPLARALNNRYPLILVDLSQIEASANQWAENLEDMLDQLDTQLPPQCYLAGWSLGGMLAVRLAIRNPEKVSGLVTLASNCSFVQTADWPWAMGQTEFQDFYQRFTTNPENTLKRFYQLQSRGDKNHKTVLHSLRNAQALVDLDCIDSLTHQLEFLQQINNAAFLKNLRCKALHLFGQHDALVPVAASEQISKHSPSSSIKVYSDAGHAPHLSQPQQVATDITDFIGEQEDQRAYLKSKTRIAQSFSKATRDYDHAAQLQRRTAKNLAEFAGPLNGTIVDLGSGTGFVTEQLISKTITSKNSTSKNSTPVLQLDISQNMLLTARKKLTGTQEESHTAPVDRHSVNTGIIRVDYICADMENLPLADASIDSAVSSMSVQWVDSMTTLFGEVYRALRPNGRFIFSSVGPATLNELKRAWQSIDSYVHVNRFASLSTIQKQAESCGFEIVSSKIDKTILQYGHVVDVMRSVKNVGAHNVNAGQNAGLMGRKKLAALQQAYEPFRRQGSLPATWEIYYLDIKKPSPLNV